MIAPDRSSPVLPDVVSLPPEEALRRLRARADPATLILAGADEAERLVMTDLKRGTESAEALVRVADLEGSPAPRARARRALAQGLAYSNRFDEALAQLGEAIALAERAGDPVEAARARMTSLHALARLGRFAEAIESGESARLAFVAAGDDLLAARADANLGVVRRMHDDPAGALQHFDRARPVLAAQPVALAQLDSNRAEAFLDLNRFADAKAAFAGALDAFRAAGVARAAAIVEGNLADLASRQGRLDTALEHFERARRALGDTDAPADAARLHAEQAEALAALGLSREAADQFNAAIPVLDAHGLAWESARARAGLGACLARIDRRPDAARELDAAAAAFDGLDHATAAARVRVLRAELALLDGDPPAAAALLSRAAPALRERPALASVARLHRAAVLLASGLAREAAVEIDAALADARALELAPLVADALRLRARTRRDGGDATGALEDLRGAVEQVERLRGTLRAERFRASFLGDRASLYEECVTATLDSSLPDRLPLAFELCERSRARSLMDAVHSAARDGRAGADALPDANERALEAGLDLLRAEMNALYASLDDGLSRPRSRTVHSRWAAEVERCERQMTEVERRLAATARSTPVFSAPSTLETARASLSPDRAMVYYFVEGASLSAFVVRPAAAPVRRAIADLAEVQERLRAFEFQVSRAIARSLPEGPAGDRLRVDAERELAALHRLLVEPLEPDLAGATALTFIPSAMLDAVPFAALRSGDRPLLDRFEISCAPSASVWTHLAGRPAPANPGPPLFVGVADQLAPEAEHEARDLAAGVSGSTLLTGTGATTAAFRRAAHAAPVIHIASHARFSAGDPLNSGIKLSDGWLTAREIAGLRLSSPVVILSGCDTGRGKVEGAGEVWGLVRSFLAAGASTLIISLWPASDRFAAETMAAFHANWYSGSSGGPDGSAAALRSAQAAMAHRGIHPAAWANFQAIGKP